VAAFKQVLASNPETVKTAGAVLAAVIACLLSLRLVRDHVSDLIAVSAALYVAQSLRPRPVKAVPTTAVQEEVPIVLQFSQADANAAFRKAFAAAQPPQPVEQKQERGPEAVVESVVVAPQSPPPQRVSAAPKVVSTEQRSEAAIPVVAVEETPTVTPTAEPVSTPLPVFAERNIAAVASAEPVVAEQQAPAAPAAEPVVVIPVAAVSVFNDSYAATVNCLVFSAAGLAVSVTARGDGSLGPLQHVEASTLVVTPASGAQILDGDRTLQRLASRHCVSKSAVAVKQHAADDGNTCCAVLQFDPGCVKRGDSVAFQYGEEFGNYAPAALCCIDDAFIAANTGIEAFLV